MRKNNKGFTLAELLIVVAIIAVLVAIAIPIFTSQLEKSRDATSVANIRSAYATAQAAYLIEDDTPANVTFTKDANNKITAVAVKDVHLAGVQSGWSDLLDGLPKDVTWTALGDDVGGDSGDYTLTFTYNDNGTITLSNAEKATTTP